jgi:LAS superfamily LD-carboxypeptidase LdcB
MSYIEHRTTVAVYSSLPAVSHLLVPVPTTAGYPQQRLHTLAATALAPMSQAVQAALGFPLVSASGWRPHRWASREQYEQVLIAKYGSVSRGQLFLAFDSPHETGLACDFGCGGLMPVSATIAQQKTTPLWRWLYTHASDFGWTPYEVEPWHWECWVPLDNYQSGAPAAPEPPPAEPLVCDPDTQCCEAPADEPTSSG